jgi:hypothetical protein
MFVEVKAESPHEIREAFCKSKACGRMLRGTLIDLTMCHHIGNTYFVALVSEHINIKEGTMIRLTIYYNAEDDNAQNACGMLQSDL